MPEQRRRNGGGRGIRTPVGLSPKAVFKTACFNRSHIPPRLRAGERLYPRIAARDAIQIIAFCFILAVLLSSKVEGVYPVSLRYHPFAETTRCRLTSILPSRTPRFETHPFNLCERSAASTSLQKQTSRRFKPQLKR